MPEDQLKPLVFIIWLFSMEMLNIHKSGQDHVTRLQHTYFWMTIFFSWSQPTEMNAVCGGERRTRWPGSVRATDGPATASTHTQGRLDMMSTDPDTVTQAPGTHWCQAWLLELSSPKTLPELWGEPKCPLPLSSNQKPIYKCRIILGI